MANAQSRFGNPANYNLSPAVRTDGDYSALEVDASGNLKVDQEAGSPVNISASALLFKGPGKLLGFFINSTSSGTIRFSDALTATNPYLGAATTLAVGYYSYPALFSTGCYVTIGSTIDVTFFVLRGDTGGYVPSMSPSLSPSLSPSISPSYSPSLSPSISVSKSPSISPSASTSSSLSPSISPSVSTSSSLSPSISPSKSPSISPSYSQSLSPSISPSKSPSISPSISQSISPSVSPSL